MYLIVSFWGCASDKFYEPEISHLRPNWSTPIFLCVDFIIIHTKKNRHAPIRPETRYLGLIKSRLALHFLLWCTSFRICWLLNTLTMLMFRIVTLRILVGFECSWVRWNDLDLYFTTHPRTFKSDKYSQSYSPKHQHCRLQRDLENHREGGTNLFAITVKWMYQSEDSTTGTSTPPQRYYLETSKFLRIKYRYNTWGVRGFWICFVSELHSRYIFKNVPAQLNTNVSLVNAYKCLQMPAVH